MIILTEWIIISMSILANGYFDKRNTKSNDYIQLINPPYYITPALNITLKYSCSIGNIIGYDVVILTNHRKLLAAQHSWNCSKSDNDVTKSVLQPLDIVHLYYETPHFTKSPHLRVWIVSRSLWNSLLIKNAVVYKLSQIKLSHELKFPPANLRPDEHGLCFDWHHRIHKLRYLSEISICSYEEEVAFLNKEILPISGHRYGVTRTVLPYKTQILQKDHKSKLSKPEFTITTWLYIVQYCQQVMCSIISRHDKKFQLLSPILFVSSEGNVHVQMAMTSGESTAAKTSFKLPKDRWILVVFTFRVNTWHLTIEYGPRMEDKYDTSYTLPNILTSGARTGQHHQPYLNDTDGVYVVGGSRLFSGFVGFYGETTLYRRRPLYTYQKDKLTMKRKLDALGLREYFMTCINLKRKIGRLVDQSESPEKVYRDNVCRWSFVQHVLPDTVSSKCPNRTQFDGYKKTVLAIATLKTKMDQNNFIEIANSLFSSVSKDISNGLEHLSSNLPLLKISSCLGNHDASYHLYVMYSNGVAVELSKTEGHKYLLIGSLFEDKLSSLSLAGKSFYAFDEFLHDPEQAFKYYVFVADKTIIEDENHEESNVQTESVRLNDEKLLQEQMDENGDMFRWIRLQAIRGVTVAQRQAASVLYWGSQGAKRDLEQAAEYYKMGAESDDPTALYDYGVILLKGHGVKKDVKLALEYFKKSASRGHASALGALGWYYLNIEPQYQLATQYLEQAITGGYTNAAANLAHMILTGKHPRYTEDDDQKALDLYSWAAVRGQKNSAVMVAHYYMIGTSTVARNPFIAADWARYVAVQNSVIGNILRRALQNFRDGKRAVSFFYYLLCAEAGVEVANFNVALLCENYDTHIKKFIETDCVWRRYNYTLHYDPKTIDPLSWIKMADYYWYAIGGTRNETMAADYYSRAAAQFEPQALFNLAYMVERDAKINNDTWTRLGLKSSVYSDKSSLLTVLYLRCMKLKDSEAYVPCVMAYWKFALQHFIAQHYLFIVLLVSAFVITLGVTIYCASSSGLQQQDIHSL